MTIDSVIKMLAEDKFTSEAYVLVREVKLHLNIPDFPVWFYPTIRVKVYKTNAEQPYSFELSHHVQTPTQATPYFPSNTSGHSEGEVIQMAISSIVEFMQGARKRGHEPKEDWLIKNDDF